MKVQNNAKKAGYDANKNGEALSRNPFQYSSDIFKQAAWTTGWKEAEKEKKVDQNEESE